MGEQATATRYQVMWKPAGLDQWFELSNATTKLGTAERQLNSAAQKLKEEGQAGAAVKIMLVEVTEVAYKAIT